MQLNFKKPNQKMDRRPKCTLLQERHTDGQEGMRRCSRLATVTKMQIKTTMRYHFTLVRMAII